MTGSRPLEGISYAEIAAARRGLRSKTVDIPCLVCGPLHQGATARRKVLRTWTLGGDRISLHCARCGLEGWVGPEGSKHEKARLPRTFADADDDDERERQRKLVAADRIWREVYRIISTAGEAYLAKRGIDLSAVPDFGGLRWHPRCPWNGETVPCVVARFTDALTGEPRGIHRRPIDGGMARTLGPMRGCVIRLWPDELVTSGLVIGEGVETVLAAATRVTHRGALLQPAWACGCAGNLADFPVLAGVEALTILVDNDAKNAGQDAAAACARRWLDAGREVIRLTPKTVGADFNDIIRGESAA
jgi:Toprim domain